MKYKRLMTVIYLHIFYLMPKQLFNLFTFIINKSLTIYSDSKIRIQAIVAVNNIITINIYSYLIVIRW